MEKYPLKIMLTNALTDSIGIANPRNSIAPAILVIDDMSLDRVKECISLSNTPDENGNNRMLVLDLVRNNKYYRIALSSGTLPNFLGLTTIDRCIIPPKDLEYLVTFSNTVIPMLQYDEYPDTHIRNYHVFEMEVLPESECLDLQQSTLEWFEETHEIIPSPMKDAVTVMNKMYLTTKYNGRDVIMLSYVDESGKTVDHRMHYLDSINFDRNDLDRVSSRDELDMAMVIDEVKAGNLHFSLTDIDGAAKLANYASGDELIRDLLDKGYNPSNIDTI